ncbi:MAG: ATP-binding cassette domain-containing protein [Treponema sp.]|nr:ATP-binding cassette domain-containing protein [Spirochaetia bacterium]MDD7458934.1 ATP-binding cassette domain-containing protein [Spirochaetales bacterium]MDY5810855.1 ATP-binding cassette domain-containing protein [Treponema sp.]
MIEPKNISKVYHLKSGDVDAVKNVNLTINDGEIYGVIGYSGAGKSTLVRCINLLEVPDSGEITVNGTKLTWTDQNGKFAHLSNHDMKKVRKGIGMIFQHFNLLDRSTVFDNIAYPLKYSGLSKGQISSRVFELLNLVGLSEKANVYPSQLSGGQKQRVAIARAITNNPKVLLSDEATSALDPDATESILSLLKELNKKLGLTIILITHEMAVIKSICTKVAVMEKGAVVEEGDVYSIFAEPKQAITKKFIASQSSLSKIGKFGKNGFINLTDGAKLIKLQFLKDAVGDALISEISRRFNVNLNIVLANVDIIQDSPLGEIIVVMKGEGKNISDAIDFLRTQNVRAFELQE